MVKVGGPSANVARGSEKGASPIHFLRVLKFSRPYYKYLIPAIICIILVALTYSLNIAAVLPIIKVIAGEQGIPAWVHQGCTEDRLDAQLFQDRENRTLTILKVKDKSPLAKIAEAGDSLTLTDEPDAQPRIVLATIATSAPGTDLKLSVISKATGNSSNVVASMGELPGYLRAGRHAATYLPQGDSRDDKMNTLIIVLLGTLVIGVFGAACRFTGEYLIALAAGLTLVSIRRRMYDHVLRMPLAQFATHGASDIISRFVQDSQDVYRGLVWIFAKTLREPLKAIFALTMAMIIDWRITLITLFIAPIAAIIIRHFGKIIRKANKRLYLAYGRMLAGLDGALKGIRVVKGYSMESYERRHLHDVDKKMLKLMLRIERVEAMSSPVFETMGRIAATIAIIFFAHLMFEGQMSFAKFGTLAALMAAMFDPIRKMSSFYNRIQRANAALDRVFEVFDMPIHEPHDRKKPALPVLNDAIRIEDVRFTYPGSEMPALDGVSLTVKKGERVAFVGPNGSGKTTLLSMLIRFLDPQDGRITFDGNDVGDYSLRSLRKQMSLITQDTVIFDDSIANNIAYGDEKLIRKIVLKRRHPERNYNLDGQETRIEQAAKAAYAHEFIMDKPEKYDTVVGEQGATLSGGQKQRLAIARAMLRNAPIFIFDEATSQVDADSEQKIHEAVEKFLAGRTALIIAHRFSTILQADRIVVMDRGKIVDSGKHEELIKRCGLYKALYGSQLLKDESASVNDESDVNNGNDEAAA